MYSREEGQAKKKTKPSTNAMRSMFSSTLSVPIRIKMFMKDKAVIQK